MATHEPIDNRRRRLLLAASGVLCAVPGLALGSSLIATPRQTPGPFYPLELPLDDDNDLTRVAGRPGPALGRITDLRGRVLDTGGNPLRDIRVEIWQCDANGRYRHPREQGSAPLDASFQGHGHTLTDPQGHYRFRTIRPVPYPGRTPHIHVAVFRPGEPPFTTQIYVRDEPRNDEDFLFRRIPEDRRRLVLAELRPATGGDPGVELEASFDLILGATPRDG